MTFPANESILPHLRELVPGPSLRGLTDGELIKRYVAHKDELAFETLLERHGPTVLGVCLRILQEDHLAEDAFQATFLIFVRKAATIGRRELVGGWLRGVAYRVAARARSEEARRRRREAQATARAPSETLAEVTARESGAILEDELHRLPQRYREVIRLCFLDGQTREDAARQLNCSLRTFHRRLERAKTLLGGRLLRRGITLPMVLTALEGGAPPATGVPGPLRAATARVVAAYAVGEPAIGSAPAIGLAQRTLAAMDLARCKLPAALLLAACVATASAALLGRQFLTDTNATAADDASDEVALTKGARTDRYGDPLPPGALARIGTVHRKQGVQINGVAWSPDGTMLASAGSDGIVSLWDAATGKELRRFDSHEFSLERVAFLPDAVSIAANGAGRIHHWNVKTGKPAASLEKGAAEAPGLFAISPDARVLASTGSYSTPAQRANKPIVLSSIATGERLRTLDGHQSGILALAFSGDGGTLVSASQDDTIRVWDTRTGTQRYQLDVSPHAGHQPPWICLAVSSDSRVFAAGSWDKTVRLWELATGKMLARLPGHSADVLSAAFSPDNRKLASGARDGTLRIWDVATGKELRVCRLGRYDWVVGVAFSPDGKTIATGDSDQRVRLWDASTGDEIQPLPEAEHRLRRIALSHKNHFAVTWGMEQTVRFWELSSGRQTAQLGMPAAVSSGPALSPDDRLVAVACQDHTIRLWDCGTLHEVHRFEIPSRWGNVYSLRFSPDGKTLAACVEDKTIRFWTIQTGAVQQFCHITGEADFVSMAFSPYGEMVAASTGDAGAFASPDAAVYVWDRRTGRELRRLQKGQDGIGSLAFSPDGRMLAVAGHCMREAGTTDGRTIRSPDLGGAVRIWDLASGQEARRFARQPVRGFTERRLVYAAAFSPDGKTLASAEDDGTVVVWEVASGQPRHEFVGHRAGVTNVRFSRDGKFLISSSFDGTALVWDMSGRSSEQRTPPMTSRDLAALWGELGSQDIQEACQGMSALAAAPNQAVDFLATRLPVVSNAGGTRIDEMIADLDSPSFAKRETANRELTKVVESTEPALRKALAASPSIESRVRLEALLRGMSSPSPQRLRELRALEVLEQINTAESRRLLQKLAGGSPQAWLTREARESYSRLAALPIAPSGGSNPPAGILEPPGRAVAANRPRNAVKGKGDVVKEPDYESGAPRYCLAVFGPRGQTRVWLVLDGDILYADRDGSGDLTTPGKAIRSSSAVTATDPKGQILSRTDNYDVGLVKTTDGSRRRWTLKVGITRGGELHHLSAETDGKPGQSVLGGGVPFAATAKEAPIVHFDGPLAVELMEGQRLTRGRVSQVYALIGTRGKGKGTFAAYQDEVLPAGAAITADFKFVTGKPDAPPMIVKTGLHRMGATPWLAGTVPVPEDAAETAGVIVSVHGSRANVSPLSSSVPIVASVAPEKNK